jgi:Family of unknown function (DUF6499)
MADIAAIRRQALASLAPPPRMPLSRPRPPLPHNKSPRELRSLDAPGFAWEFLRRNPDFERERSNLERAARRGALNSADADAFARRWGVQFLRALPQP